MYISNGHAKVSLMNLVGRLDILSLTDSHTCSTLYFPPSTLMNLAYGKSSARAPPILLLSGCFFFSKQMLEQLLLNFFLYSMLLFRHPACMAARFLALPFYSYPSKPTYHLFRFLLRYHPCSLSLSFSSISCDLFLSIFTISRSL